MEKQAILGWFYKWFGVIIDVFIYFNTVTQIQFKYNSLQDLNVEEIIFKDCE